MRERHDPGLVVHQSHDADGVVHLQPRGELDLASAPRLRPRFAHLALAGRPTRLDLTQLTFIDCCGLRAILVALADARATGWELTVDPEAPRIVRRLCRLTGTDGQLWPDLAD